MKPREDGWEKEKAHCGHVNVDKCECYNKGYQWQFISWICYKCEHYRDDLFTLFPEADDGDILEFNGQQFTKGKKDYFFWDEGGNITQLRAKRKTWRIIKNKSRGQNGSTEIS